MFSNFGGQNQGKKQHKINKPQRQQEPDEDDIPLRFLSGGNHGQQKQSKTEMSGDASRGRGWNALLRFGAFVASVLGMYISAQFSVDGFKFSVDDRTWIGWGMAAILIIIQSVWQKFGNNVTLFVMAMVCYGYGIVTNVVGMIANRGGYNDNPMSLVVPIIFGILLEVFPEPVMAWSISGDITSDPLKKLLDRIGTGVEQGTKKYSYDVSDDIRQRLGH